MRVFRTTLTLGLCALLYAVCGQAAESGERYSLRQNFSAGDFLTETISMNMDDGALRYVLPDGTAITGKMTVSSKQVMETEFLSSTRKRVRYVSDVSKTYLEVAGEVETEEETGPLQGAVLLADMNDGKWVFRLENGEPTEAQAEELQSLSGTLDDQLAYPAEPVPRGHTWEIPPMVLKGLIGDSFHGLKGQVDSVLNKASHCGGHVCASVHSEGAIAATALDDDGAEMGIEFEVIIDETRKLGPQYDNKATFKGRWKISSEPVIENEDGTKTVLQMNITGDLTGTYDASLARKD